MGRLLTLTFTLITSVCAVLLLSSFIHFACAVNKKKQGKSVDSLVKKCAFVSLFGYTTFVILSLVLYLIQSLYYIPSTQINYSTLICQMQTFNIVFFMTGKLAMYIYFLSLVHVAFRGSFLAYPVKLIFFIGICFFFLMCTIGAFYMVFLYIDFSSVGPINSPADCDKFEASKFSTITIWTGATCDAIWSFTCLSLFYLRLRKLTKLMKKQHKLERKETDDMLERIKLKRSSKSLNDLDLNTHRNIIVITGDKTDGEKHVQTDDENIIQSGLPTVNELNDDDECALSIAPDGMQTIDNDIDIDIDIDIDESSLMTINDEETSTHTQTEEEYTLMKYKYQNAPHIIAYDRKDCAQSSSNKVFISLKLKFDNTSSKIKKKIKRRNSWSSVRKNRKENVKKKKPDIVHKFLPIILKLSILSAWCAFSTVGLGFGLWIYYPTLTSVIDSTVNGFCVYLSFGFTKPLYELLCLPFISCKNCENYRNVVNEANKMEKDKRFDTQQNVLG
eukprot:79887_1